MRRERDKRVTIGDDERAMSDEHSPISDHELISAYVDGELTAAERQRADTLLAGSAELRQWRDELVALRDDIQSLPRLRLGDDLTEKVLRQAEQTMLLGTHRPTNNSMQADAPQNWHMRWPRGYRPWLWAGAAIAASLLVTFFSSEDTKVAFHAPPAVTATQPVSEAAPAVQPSLADEQRQVMRQAADQPAGYGGAAAAVRGAAQQIDVTKELTRNGYVVQETGRLGLNVQAGEQIAQQLAVIDRHMAGQLLDDNVTVVQIAVDPAQLANDPFISVLTKNGVSIDSLSNNLAGINHAKQQLQSNIVQNQQRRAVNRGVAAVELDMVYVVAAPAQVHEIVRDLNSQPATFRQVVVSTPQSIDSAEKEFAKKESSLAAAAKPQTVDAIADKRKSETESQNQPAEPLRKNSVSAPARDLNTNQRGSYARIAIPSDGTPAMSANLNGRPTVDEPRLEISASAPGSAPLAAKAAQSGGSATASPAAPAPVVELNRAREQNRVADYKDMSDTNARQAPLQRVLFVFRDANTPQATAAPAAQNAGESKTPTVPIAPRD